MKRLLTAAMAVLVTGFLLSACSSNGNEAGKGSGTAGGSPAGTSSAASTGGATTYPIQTDKTLTYWAEMTGNIVGVKASLDEVPFFQEWQKRTGVKPKFVFQNHFRNRAAQQPGRMPRRDPVARHRPGDRDSGGGAGAL